MKKPVVWSRPYYGVTHGTLEGKKSYVTVVDRKTWAELQRWFPGCGFSPTTTHHTSAEVAKQKGERWLRSEVK
jgi:hypothetical protein